MRKWYKWFTLIEMIIVLVILSLLAAFLLPRVTGQHKKARDLARKWDLYQASTAFLLYYNDYNSYPATGGCIDSDLDWFVDYGAVPPSDPAAGRSTLWCDTKYRYIVLEKDGIPSNAVLFVAKVEDRYSANYDMVTTPNSYEEAQDAFCSLDESPCGWFTGEAYYAVLQ